jgi:hypothetical protein
MAKFDISQFAKSNPGVTAAMSMKRGKHPKKKPTRKDQNQQDMQGAAARRLAKLKGKSDGPNFNK